MPGLAWGGRASGSASTSVVKGKHETRSGGLEIAGRHLARLVVALQIEADLLAFDEVTHACPLDGGDVDERVGAAIVRLDEAEALGGVEPFNCASGHDEPFHSNIEKPPRQGAADDDSDFERKGSCRTWYQPRDKQSSASKFDGVLYRVYSGASTISFSHIAP